jgi:hypothetical protein
MASKRDEDHPKIMLRRALGGFEPAHQHAEEQLQHYGVGALVEVQVWQGRSQPQLALYWVILHQCVDNSENRYGRAEDLHEVLKVTLGYSRRVNLLVSHQSSVKAAIAKLLNRVKAGLTAGIQHWAPARACIALIDEVLRHVDDMGDSETLILPGSIALNRMDQAEFKVYFDRAMNELRKAGYPVDDYLREGKKKIAPYYPPKSSLPRGRNVVPHPHEERPESRYAHQ